MRYLNDELNIRTKIEYGLTSNYPFILVIQLKMTSSEKWEDYDRIPFKTYPTADEIVEELCQIY